ncbi:MAG: ATP synthase F1 subunit epsilon [Flavobacteriaceae bacterium]|nr:ATP synthase F1 subunit epsilon [Flavobacteriaceae bacterium]|tara:strand:- start:1318 stop:1716 length:399 start_codon:yes stop_codon:yes gene_type:complete
MTQEFKLEIVNPEKSFFIKDDVIEVVLPGYEGDMGILKDHISIISFLKPGIVKVFTKVSEEKFYVEDGIIEFKDNTLSILTSYISSLKDIKRSHIDQLLKDAEKDLLDEKIYDQKKFLINQKIDVLKSIIVN